jgi:hypothetical protein
MAIHGNIQKPRRVATPCPTWPPGLYQALLAECLEQQLLQLQETLVATYGLVSQEAPHLVALHLAALARMPWST